MKRLLSPLLFLVLATGCATHLPADAQHSGTKTPPRPNTTSTTSNTPYGQRTDAQQWAKEMAARQGQENLYQAYEAVLTTPAKISSTQSSLLFSLSAKLF